ncbi:hypothetical protein J1614_004087 [Plenodomus biglobosus]|nr:hypothetical protein J1614_004087 [Plenodomus biglobosus]
MLDFTDHHKPAHDGAAAFKAERDGSSMEVLSKEKLFDKGQLWNLCRLDRYRIIWGWGEQKQCSRVSRREQWSHENSQMAEYLEDEMIRTVREQGSEQQQKYWMPRILHCDVIGCYTLTELGHGSNVWGLEANGKAGDPVRKQFEIYSPFLAASRWWNGSLGRTATHAIVVAQMHLPKPSRNKPSDPPTDTLSDSEYDPYGPQTFILHTRDEKIHQPLSGIAVGDVGPKYGYASMDNGLHAVRPSRRASIGYAVSLC